MGIRCLPEEPEMLFLLSTWTVFGMKKWISLPGVNAGAPIICQGQNLHQNQLAPELPQFEDRDIKTPTSWFLCAFVKLIFPFP